MNGIDFFKEVQAHPELRWIGCCAEAAEVYVCCPGLDTTFAVPIGSILAHSWIDLEEVLTCKRSPQILMYLTRIVGYFSQVRNWNRSKVAELRDRAHGMYVLPSPEEAERADLHSCHTASPVEK